MAVVAIIGAGELGQGLRQVLSARLGIAVGLWDIRPEVVPNQLKLADLVTAAEFVFLCVPTRAVRQAAQSVAPHLADNAVAVGMSKGIEAESLKTTDEILAEEINSGAYAFLGGPMLAEELSAQKMGAAVAASPNIAAADRLSQLFSGTKLKIEVSPDVHGAALAGVLKNIYAFGLGVVSGLELGANFRGWFLSQALDEMSRLLVRLGGQAQTAYSAAGLGDLVATGFSEYSSNFQAGRDVAATGEIKHKAEGVLALPSLIKIMKGDTDSYEILRALSKIVIEPAEPGEAFRGLS